MWSWDADGRKEVPSLERLAGGNQRSDGKAAKMVSLAMLGAPPPKAKSAPQSLSDHATSGS
jgi:hypothetical protein